MKFSAPVHPVRGLEFPLDTEAAVGHFRFSLRSPGLAVRPSIELPDELVMDWREIEHGDHDGAVSMYGKSLSGKLRIAAVQPRHEASLSLRANGERRAHIVDAIERLGPTQQSGRRLRVYWDRSMSRREHDLPLEHQLLARHIAESKPSVIDLVLFNSSGASVRRVTAQSLQTALAEVTYRGATSFAVLEKLAAPEADSCLMFSDGVATIDARPQFAPGCEVFALTSSPGSDRGYLQRLAGGSAAAVLQIDLLPEAELLTRLRGASPRVIRASTEQGRTLNFTTLDGGDKGWSVITDAPATGDILLQIAGVRGKVEQRRYSPVLARRQSFAAAGALWAASEIGRLAGEDNAHDALVALSREYSVASTHMAFLVLETAEDYVDADIEPAKSHARKFLDQYRELRADRDARNKQVQEGRLGDVLESWQEVVEWWERRFDPHAPKQELAKHASALADAPTPERSAQQSARAATTVADAIHAQDVDQYAGGEFDEIAVTGMRASPMNSLDARRVVAAAPVIELQLAAWDVKRPYIAALEAASAAEVDPVILDQQLKYGAVPAFYFDVAEWLHRHGREPDAMEMLLSALDLTIANEETAAMVADRLQRYGAQDRAIWLLERAAARTDYLPQPRRSLALALARRAGEPGAAHARDDLERAVKLLDEVIMTPWEGDFDGIELISLMEVNSLLPRLRALGVRKISLDERLRKMLDVDLRVVIEWNTIATDMDLWVDEPNGERAIYSNALTVIGGRLSNDMTAGFGPEEYLLRRAAPGQYRVSVNVYDTDAINPNGSTVVSARLFRDFGRSNQSEQTMEIELVPDEKGEKLIGTFMVK